MIKLPEPVAYRYLARNFYKYTGRTPNFQIDYSSLKPEALYPGSQLKQAICDVLEEAAKDFDLLTGREMFGPEVADKLRQIKEQL